MSWPEAFVKVGEYMAWAIVAVAFFKYVFND